MFTLALYEIKPASAPAQALSVLDAGMRGVLAAAPERALRGGASRGRLQLGAASGPEVGFARLKH